MRKPACSTSRSTRGNGPRAPLRSPRIRRKTKSASAANCSACSVRPLRPRNMVHRYSARWWAKFTPVTKCRNRESEMTAKTVSEIVRLGPVIPVLAFDSPEQGENVSRALHAGGVKVLEITLRTEAGLKAIERASHLAEDIVVGVGTITRPAQCAQAKKAGATFGVSPGLTKDLHKAAQDAGLPLLPGVMTPSDIIVALELGYEIVKFFPAQQAGGVPMLQAFAGPFPTLKFCPTGGITAETA